MPKIPDASDVDDTPTPVLPGQSGPATVKVRVTKFGAGKVSTGVHVAELGDVMAKAGDVLVVAKSVAEALEKRGLAEIQ